MVDDFSREEKEKLIKAWGESALEEFVVAKDLFKAKHYSQCLFFCQLALEKTLKAAFIATNGECPPPSHNLVKLAEGAKIELTKEWREQLGEITSFNVEARYDIRKEKLYKKATVLFTEQFLKITEDFLEYFAKKI